MLGEPVLDALCEWLYQRYTVSPNGDYEGWCRGWQIFERRAPSIRKREERTWEDFLQPHPKWRSFRNGELEPNEIATYLAGPVLEGELLRAANGTRVYSVDLGIVYAPMAAEGGVLHITVDSDSGVSVEPGDSCWIA